MLHAKSTSHARFAPGKKREKNNWRSRILLPLRQRHFSLTREGRSTPAEFNSIQSATFKNINLFQNFKTGSRRDVLVDKECIFSKLFIGYLSKPE